MGDAKFSVNGQPFSSEPLGVDVADGALLTFALESTTDVVSVKYEVKKVTKNVAALLPVFSPVSGVAATPASSVTAQLTTLGGPAHTYLVRCTINNGTDANGRIVDAYVKERMVCVRNALGFRIPLFTERGEYDINYGWQTALEDLINGIAAGPERTPADAGGAVFWGRGITDPAFRTMTGSRVDSLINGLGNGLTITRRAGTPIIDTTVSRNGHHPLRMDATTELRLDTGGPIGNQSFGIMLLTDGSDATPFTGLCRCGALSAAGGVGLTTGGRYGAGLVAGAGQPNAAPPEAIANGTLRIAGIQNLPQYGRIACTVEGRYPAQTSGEVWNYTGNSPLALDGSIALGKIETGGVVNLSGVYDFVVYLGELAPADRAMIADYWCTRFSKTKSAPGLLIMGDSNSVPSPGSNATTTWPDRLATSLAAQLALDGRTMPVFRNIALSGKYAGGLWSLQGTTSPTGAYQADGNYVAFVGGVTNHQGIQESAAYSRSGCREYEIALVMFGTNDIVSEGISGEVLIDRLKYICATLRDQGYYVILQTVLNGSTNPSYLGGAHGVAQATGNTWIVNNAVAEGFARRIVDHSNMPWNATYFGADLLHPNDTGQALMAANAHAVVEAAIREDLAA